MADRDCHGQDCTKDVVRLERQSKAKYRFMRTWVNHDGSWQVAAFQSTRISP